MLFGAFVEEMRQGVDQATAFREAFELVDAAEAWGLDGVWLGELHMNPARSVMSTPLIVCGAIAARTRRLRIGTAVTLLPLANPLRIAEEVATLDQISDGRFDFGVGRSGSPRAYDAYGIPYAESQARFREALDIIRRAWQGEPFSYDGRFFQFKNAAVSPRPRQLPHPPIRMAATTDDTYPMVGRLGLNTFVGLRNVDVPDLRDHLVRFRAGWREAGHAGEPEVFLRIPVYAGLTEAEAREEPRETITYYFHRQAELIRAGLGRSDTGSSEARLAQADKLASMSYDEMLRTKVAFGTAKHLIDRFMELREELGLAGLVAEMNPGGYLSAELEKRTLWILTHEVMPAFK